MRAVDTNILIYAFFEDSPFHEQSKAAISALALGQAPWAIPWPCIHEFFGVVTNMVFAIQPARAMAQIDAWLESPSLLLLGETSGHWHQLSSLLKTSKIAGSAVHDAKIAAICIAHGVSELLTLDRDFSSFPELKVLSVR